MATQLAELAVSINLGNVTIFTHETNKNKMPQLQKFNFYFIRYARWDHCTDT